MSAAIKVKVYKKLNEELGNDIENLSKCKEMSEALLAKKQEVEQMLSLVSSEVPSKVSEAALNVDEACNSIKTRCGDVAELLERMENQKSKTENIVLSIKDNFTKISSLERLLSYLLVLQRVQELSDSIESSIDIGGAVDDYEGLCDLYHNLGHSKCSHLIKFIYETIQYWNNILKKQLSEEFTQVMKGVQWPYVSSNSILASPQPDSLTKFQNIVRHLLRVQLPGEENKEVKSSLVVKFPALTLPMSLLLQPLKKRFTYHFNSNRQTNRLDKPEWYFTQILTWIRDHEMFVVKWVQPVFNQLDILKSAKVELMSGLVEMAIEKLEADCEQVQYDDGLFSHTVDEALGFDRELKTNYNYPSLLPSATSVLTHAQVFIKWIRMERKFARDKMDAVLSSETAWCSISPEEKTTEAAHAFLAILSAMKERYSSLVQPGHKLQFVEVEVELWDDVRVALLQVISALRHDPLNSHFPDVLNTLSYLLSALEQSNASPTMLLLEHYKLQYEEEGSPGGGLFTQSLSLLNRLSEQLLSELSETVMLEVKARSRPYRRNTWWQSDSGRGLDDIVSESACPMFQVLSDKLHMLQTRLADSLFQKLWKDVATQLNTFLIEELVCENSFSVRGAEILERDVRRALLPLFLQYTQHPEAYFTQLLEACGLLKLPQLSTAIRRTVITGENQESLLSLEVPHLNHHQAATILKRRLDLTVEVM